MRKLHAFPWRSNNVLPASSVERTLEAVIKLDVAQTWLGDVAVLEVTGTVDLRTAHVLSNATADAIAKKPGALLVDLTHVGSLAPAATQVLIDARRLMGAASGFAVVADGPDTGHVLQAMGLTRTLTVVPTLGEALESVGRAVEPSPPNHQSPPPQAPRSRDPSLELFGNHGWEGDREHPSGYVGRHRAPD